MAFPIILSNSLDVVLFRDKEGLFYQILLWSNLNLLHLWFLLPVKTSGSEHLCKDENQHILKLFEFTCLIS